MFAGAPAACYCYEFLRTIARDERVRRRPLSAKAGDKCLQMELPTMGALRLGKVATFKQQLPARLAHDLDTRARRTDVRQPHTARNARKEPQFG
jgi:hypothetical protein